MTAIYARQLVERQASISIEMQIADCEHLLPEDTPRQCYIDRGYSGTHVEHPAFQAMLGDVRAGKIQEVCVYKLDRISRSLCDFAEMMRLFRAHEVKLRSFRENFDTESEIGSMLLHLLMMFAELEQKTIAGRVRDNYYARGTASATRRRCTVWLPHGGGDIRRKGDPGAHAPAGRSGAGAGVLHGLWCR